MATKSAPPSRLRAKRDSPLFFLAASGLTGHRGRNAAIISLVVTLFVILDPTRIETALENRLIDARHRFFAKKTASTDDIVIVDISEDSLQLYESVYGRWPWPRSIQGEIVDYLTADGARVIAFDIIFAERTLRQEIDVEFIEGLKKRIRTAASPGDRAALITELEMMNPLWQDAQFAKAAARSGRVVQASHFFATDKELSLNLVASATEAELNKVRDALDRFSIPEPENRDNPIFHNATIPLEDLVRTSVGVGFTNFTPDPDGPGRRFMPVVGIKDPSTVYPAFPIAVGAAALGVEIKDIGVSARKILLGGRTIPRDASGSILIRYQGGKSHDDVGGRKYFQSFYTYIPIALVLESIDQLNNGESTTLEPYYFKDKVVLIGTSAAGLHDLRATPFTSAIPGVDIQANIIDNILSSKFLEEPAPLLSWCYIFLSAALVALATSRTTALAGVIFSSCVFLLATGIPWLFFAIGIVLPMAAAGSAAIFSFLAMMLLRYVTEEKEKQRVRGTFGQYVSSAVLEEVLKNPEAQKLGGQKRHMTVLFSDIAGFTAISETLPPETISKMLNDYLTAMMNCVLQTEGTLDKFIGDAIVAEWNAPLDQVDHAARACETALHMKMALSVLHSQWRDQNLPLLEMRIGINSGEMVVGNMGAAALFDYTVIGNEVNTAARLEPLNKEFGTVIAISRATRNELLKHRPDEYCVRVIATTIVKGRTEPLWVYELVNWSALLKREEIEMVGHYRVGMKNFFGKNFDEAVGNLTRALEFIPGDTAALHYLNEAKILRHQTLPENWSGVHIQRLK